MIDDKYGKTFRELRHRKGFKLKHFTGSGVSLSSVSRFELGETDLGFNNFYRALEAMDTPLYEYEQLLNEFHQGSFDETFSKLYPAYFGADITMVRKILTETHDPFLKIAVKCLYIEIADVKVQLTARELETITDYLLDLTEWGVYELSILACAITHLSARHISVVLDNLFEDTSNHRNFLHYRRLIIQVAVKGAWGLISEGKMKKSKAALDYAYAFTYPDNLFSRNICLFIRGYWTYTFEDQKSGREMANRAIEIFDDLGSELFVKFCLLRMQKDFH